MAGHVEIERKYETDHEFTLPDLRDVPGLSNVAAPVRHTLLARYYDTQDLRLARHGITLRRRTGGDDDGWHLKLPKTKGERHEISRPAGDPDDDVPAELAELVLARTRGAPLTTVAELRTDRTEHALLADDGSVLGQLADDRVTGLRLDRLGDGVTSWRELEVELVEGSPDLLSDVGDQLVGSGARSSDAPAKLVVVLGDDAAPAERPERYRTAAETMTTYLHALVERMLSYDPLVRLADHDDDSVHKMRTSIRRVRSILRTHRRLLDRARTDVLDAELKWLADALGEVRDLEVLQARFHGQLAAYPDPPGRPGWLKQLADQESAARDGLRERLRSARYMALLQRLDDVLTDPPVTGDAHRKARKQEREIVARARRKMIKKYRAAEGLPEGPDRDAALHGTRKAAKRLRYTADAAEPVLGKPARRISRRASKLQDVLGAHQDRIVAADHLSGIEDARADGPADAYALGILIAVQDRTDTLEDLPRTWKRVADTKLAKKL
ncbi:CYTH and CHAD domain-containing protein [Spirillospora sp. NPDC047279]|uniref:CYTH and CHAD domain-containing protein n=1 Tax=Spirillospora sp. NPDC047279 TaxID=3155478 RepID=UPI0033D1394B